MKQLDVDEQTTLILIFAFIFGAWFRLMPAWLAGFPINDGGMFYTMILDLQANHYVPPLFTTYNQLSIPYAYPPLGFYVAAGLSDLLNISPLSILRWLPGIVNALGIPAFYFFAKAVFKDKFRGAIATLVYALIPHLTAWNSMGGGLTRSFGLLFMLLTLGYAQRLFETNGVNTLPSETPSEVGALWGAIIFGGLTTLSHPESPLYMIGIMLLIWAMKSRSLKGVLHGFLVALGILLIAAPWYGMLIYRHGLEPFKSISQSGSHSLSALLLSLDIGSLAEEPYLDLFGALGLLGIMTLIVKQDYFIPLMLAVIFLAQPRSAYVIGNIPFAMAAGFFVTEVVLPGLSQLQVNKKKLAVFFLIAGIYIFRNSMEYGMSHAQWVLSEPDKTAMQWIARNTPTDGKFLVISGDRSPFCDPVNEWFPALAGRRSQTTAQGTEWLLYGNIWNNVVQIHNLQVCIDQGLECFTREAEKLGKPFNYVYISIAPPTNGCVPSDDATFMTRGLIIALGSAPEYSVAYRSDKVVLFKRK